MTNYGKIGIKQIEKKEKLYALVERYNDYITKKNKGLKVKRPVTKIQIHKLQVEVNELRKITGTPKLNVKHELLSIKKKEG